MANTLTCSHRTPTFRACLMVLTFLAALIATASPAHSQAFTINQILWKNPSPAIIPINYDLTGAGVSAPNPIPVGMPVHIVYGIQVTSSNTSPTNVSLQITLPAAFTTTNVKCVKFPGGGAAVPFACSIANLATGSMGALNVADDKVIVVMDGFFTQAGPFTAFFTASRNSTSEPTSLNMVAGVGSLPVDLSVTKVVQPKTGGAYGPTATIPFGGTVTYKIIVKNESAPAADHSTDFYLAPLLRLIDTITAPAGNDVNLSLSSQNFNCTSILGADCPTMPAGLSNSIGANSSQNLLLTVWFPYPSTSTGFMPAGSSFEITFDVTITTGATCSPLQNNKLLNRAYFTYSNGTQTVSDVDPSNNDTASNSPSVSLTGLATTCPTPPTISMTKTLLSPASAAWGTPFTYEITIKNTSTVTLTGLYMNDYVWGNNTPPFTATFSAANVVCNPACISPLPVSAAPLVQVPYTFLFRAYFAPLAPGATQTIQYIVRYDATCASSETAGSITNYAAVGGPAAYAVSHTANMPELSKCDLTVSKKQTSGPASFSSFPVTLGYQVQFKNNSLTNVRVGSIVDAMGLDSPAYGNIPATYSYSCTSTGVTGLPALTGNSTATIQYNSPLWAGVKLIDLSTSAGADFAPGGDVTCNLSVTLNQPPTNDSKCQGPGTHNVVNTAVMDLPYPLNTNQSTLAYSSSVTRPLPDCIAIVVGKTAPNVFSGASITFTLTVNNAGGDTVSNIVLNDNVPANFTNVTWTCASGCTASGTGNSVSVPLDPLPAGSTATILVSATAPVTLGSYCNSDNAVFNPFPAGTFFEGDQNALTKASACVQVTAAPPKLSKQFDPVKVGLNGVSTLTFNITNGAGDPKQTGISFSDTLPVGLQFTNVIANGCGGTTSISADGRTLIFKNGQLIGPNADGSGKHSCQISVQVKASDVCGIFRNDKTNFSDVVNLDVSNVNAQLEVTGCSPPVEECSVKSGEISCKADAAGGYLYSFTVTNNTGSVVTDVLLTPKANSNITINPQQPQLPLGGLAPGASITLQTAITGGTPQTPACFTVTLMTKDGDCCTTEVCPVLPECCAVINVQSVECNADGTYTAVVSIANTSTNNIEHIYFYPAPGSTLSPIYIPVSLPPGGVFQTKLVIKGPPGRYCFNVSLHTAEMKSCCKGEYCFVLPECGIAKPR